MSDWSTISLSLMFLCGVFVAPLSTCVFLFIVIACYCYYCHQSYLFCCFWDMFSIMVRISSNYQHNHHSLFYHFWLNTQTECVLNVLQRFLIVTMFMFKTKNTYPYNYSQIAETSESWTISWLGGSVGQYIYIYIYPFQPEKNVSKNHGLSLFIRHKTKLQW